jgi:hypothetical protein
VGPENARNLISEVGAAVAETEAVQLAVRAGLQQTPVLLGDQTIALLLLLLLPEKFKGFVPADAEGE